MKISGILTLILMVLSIFDPFLLAGELRIGDSAPMLTGKNIKSDGL
ncbi:MAG: hypothetical protein HOD92_27145 [Deltaproteobacteria bacterium]|jgi:hypothetical protein|nr:hypothetical protein [Deltaproteobacteria bacterium]MBT4526845.1 hypothetical protein [Deltaproteobacteria bacterium]